MTRPAAIRATVASLTRAAVAVAVLIGLYAVLPADVSSGLAIAARVAVASAVIAAALLWQLRAIVRSDRPVLRAIEAMAVAITLMVVLFATAYAGMSKDDPTAFTTPLSKTTALYFTLTTLTTVGYGDIVAATDAARIVVMVQMVFNVAVIGVSVKLILGTARDQIAARRDR
jgi:voltage-gated potassium channel